MKKIIGFYIRMFIATIFILVPSFFIYYLNPLWNKNVTLIIVFSSGFIGYCIGLFIENQIMTIAKKNKNEEK